MAPEMMINQSPRLSQWDLEYGYQYDEVIDGEYPIRVFNAEHGAGLRLHLQLYERDLEHLCRGVGFLLLISCECIKLCTN